MRSVPEDIARLVGSRRGSLVREDGSEVALALRRLGVRDDSQLWAFFRTYKASPLVSRQSYEELMDPASPSPQMEATTAFVRQVYGVPAGYVCLSSAEGEGFFLYDLASEAVYDLSVREVAALECGGLSPRWPDFFEFIKWYLQ